MRVLIFGTFDHLHRGHEYVITEAMKRGDVTVIVARDKNVKRIKKRLPSQSESERAQSLRMAFPAVIVLLGDPSDFLAPVRSFRPDLIMLGYDQKLPPGVMENNLPCRIERLPAYKPEEFKSSKRRHVDSIRCRRRPQK